MLTQSEADALFAMSKKPKSSNSMIFTHAIACRVCII